MVIIIMLAFAKLKNTLDICMYINSYSEGYLCNKYIQIFDEQGKLLNLIIDKETNADDSQFFIDKYNNMVVIVV